MLDKSKIELIVIASIILIFILGIIFAAKPGRLLKQARNAARISHMGTILNAIYGYTIDSQGFFPACIPDFGKGAIHVSECAELLPYIYEGQFPKDPYPDAKYMIKYVSGAENKVRVFSTAPEAQGLEVIR